MRANEFNLTNYTQTYESRPMEYYAPNPKEIHQLMCKMRDYLSEDQKQDIDVELQENEVRLSRSEDPNDIGVLEYLPKQLFEDFIKTLSMKRKW